MGVVNKVGAEVDGDNDELEESGGHVKYAQNFFRVFDYNVCSKRDLPFMIDLCDKMKWMVMDEELSENSLIEYSNCAV